jgi:hypothetical protein
MRKKQKKNITHVYTSTRVEENKAIWRLYNFLVLLAMAGMQGLLHINFPETGYLLVIGAILGVDVPALVRRFIKKV